MLGSSTTGDEAAGASGVADGCGEVAAEAGDEDARGVVDAECVGRER
jgi:hypothetical protein